MDRSYETKFAVDRLRVLLFKNNISIKKLSEILGCSYWTANRKYKGEAAFNLHDMLCLSKHLNIPNDKLIFYFCELPVRKSDKITSSDGEFSENED